MGSKTRIAKYILPIMLKERKEGQVWVEPFVGGGNMIDKVTGPRIGTDFNVNAITALSIIQNFAKFLPKNNTEFTEEDYNHCKKGGEHNFKAFAGFAYSFASKWLGGWARDKDNNDYVARAFRSAQKQSLLLKGVILAHRSYEELELPKNSLIYCDPPYQGTTGYKTGDFDHTKFWQWCRDKKKEGHTIFISEYNAPSDFICVWEKEVNVGVEITNTKRKVEKLFTL